MRAGKRRVPEVTPKFYLLMSGEAIEDHGGVSRFIAANMAKALTGQGVNGLHPASRFGWGRKTCPVRPKPSLPPARQVVNRLLPEPRGRVDGKTYPVRAQPLPPSVRQVVFGALPDTPVGAAGEPTVSRAICQSTCHGGKLTERRKEHGSQTEGRGFCHSSQ